MSKEAQTLGRRERKRTQTLDRIARTAFELFGTHGYESVTMEQIAAEADVARGTLYNHFPTKEAVLAHAIHAELAEDLERVLPEIARRPTFKSAVGRILDESASWCQKHRDYLHPYLRFQFLQIGLQEAANESASPNDMVGAYAQLIERAQRSGELRADMSAEQLATLLHHLYLAALLRWLGNSRLELQDEFAAVLKLFLHGACRLPTTRHRRQTSS
jgi:TetR/AcrR family transcriptional regulator, regulator of autoinduction and epiphytic fitness